MGSECQVRALWSYQGEVQATLIPLASWLPALATQNPGRHKQVVNLIDQLLPDGAPFQMANGPWDAILNDPGYTYPEASGSGRLAYPKAYAGTGHRPMGTGSGSGRKARTAASVSAYPQLISLPCSFSVNRFKRVRTSHKACVCGVS